MRYIKRRFKNPAAQRKHDLQRLDLLLPKASPDTIKRIVKSIQRTVTRNGKLKDWHRQTKKVEFQIADVFAKYDMISPAKFITWGL